MRRLIVPALAALLAACGGSDGAAQPANAASSNAGVESRPPNATGQAPAFAGQTRAPAVTADVAYEVQVVAEGLDRPWALAFLPDGRMLVTERPGRLRLVETDGKLSRPINGVPSVVARGQGGLLGIALDPAGNVWVANSWNNTDIGFSEVPDEARSTHFAANTTVVFFGLAKPVRTPLIGPAQAQ